ncbi:lipid asymmetry maintenance protein MlaB [Brachymonas sp.]|uniref:STAS domain-containing protein n=1 Tax=Brachymonas sp. TaxID=1936292 RepID=UPI0035B35762
MLSLPSEITVHTAPAVERSLREQLLRELGDAVPSVDAGALSKFDSSALAVLLALQRACEKEGHALSISHAPSHLRTLAQLYGVGQLLWNDDVTGTA